MVDLFGYLFLGSLFALIVGLSKPTAFARFIKNPTRKKVGLIFTGLLIVSLIGFGVTSDKKSTNNSGEKQTQEKIVNNEPTKVATPTKQPDQKKDEKLNVKTDSYKSYDGKTYKFEIISQKGEDKMTASFTPFIPNKDSNLVEAILRVFIAQYGANAQINPSPTLEARNGVNLIKFAGDKINYYVSPIKEDTGEIHSIVFWKE